MEPEFGPLLVCSKALVPEHLRSKISNGIACGAQTYWISISMVEIQATVFSISMGEEVLTHAKVLETSC
jgi:hypothetical protein